MTTAEDLEAIAQAYHVPGSARDMVIERICQEVELDWLVGRFRPDQAVLEMGYGDGVTFDRLCLLERYTVLEGSPSLASKARQHAANRGSSAQIVETLFEDFLPEAKFDWIYASHVLEHVDDPVQTLALLARWVEPQSGHVVITVPNAESIHRRVGVAMGLHSKLDDLSARDLTVGHQRVYSLGSLTQTLELAGWGISEVQGFFLKPLSNAQLVESGDEAIRALCEVSLELPPEICANLTVIARPRSADTFVDSA